MNAMKTGKILVAQTAPSVRVAMAEELGEILGLMWFSSSPFVLFLLVN